MLKKLSALFLFLVIGLAMVLMPAHSKAATGLVYLSPSSYSVKNGASITVNLRINPGTPVDAAQATVNFDNSKLQETSTTVSTSAFSLTVQKIVSSNSVSITVGNLGGTVNSDSLIATITFKALVGSGSSSISLSNVNATYSGSYTNPGSGNATVNFTTPVTSTSGSSASKAAPKSTGSSSKTTQPTTPTAPSTPKAVVKPNLTTDVKNLQYSLATITVASDIKVKTAINFGTSQDKLDETTAFTDLGTSGNFDLSQQQLIPGTTYYYQVIAKDADGNTTTGPIKSFKTKGYSIQITILDGDYKPLANQSVTLHSSPTTTKTDGKGVASFTDVEPGHHDIEYTSKGKTYKQSIYVDDNVSTKGSIQTASAQSAAVIIASLKGPAASKMPYIVGGVMIVIGLIIGADLILKETAFGKRLKSKLSHPKTATTTSLPN